ncbi:hypothetical protein CARUB_v10024212mg [Capsella rubella]|uniref:Zinc finger GRF-type domain-containing protein n=1 Tax=Capsella rubella TaxID=81985 RepID=R0HVE9_9BRAS|nr:uncharacterized protein LOC17889098 [Capsella rubella]EOA28038.1 hypothetical protein CARUB_v10024212mg [Capsella rubella]
MRHDYSYSQDSESDHHYTEDSVEREIVGLVMMDESQSAFYSASRTDPEIEVGFPTKCYCGGQALLQTSYTRNDPGRKYFTCANLSDGEMHVHKWWDVAVMEEMRERAREHKEKESITEEKLLNLHQVVLDLQTRRVNFKMVLGVSFSVLCVFISMVVIWCQL